MKATIPFSRQTALGRAGAFLILGALVGLLPATSRESRAAEAAASYATAEAAVSALAAAVRARDADALRSIFGPVVTEMTNPDRVQATNEYAAVAAALAEGHRVVSGADGRWVVEIGPDRWPFPIPLVQQNGRWSFDTAAGKEELLNRRIGRNELAVLEVMRAYVAAQREYASRDRDGDGVLEFAQKLLSAAGQTDGLFWPPELDGAMSPFGPLVAQAQSEGYSHGTTPTEAGPQPFHGYLFRILKAQGRHAPGGKHDFVINGNMIAGFAMVAWPADYGESGVMTFIVNQQGKVLQRDLGKETARVVRRMKAYDPDPAWRLSRE